MIKIKQVFYIQSYFLSIVFNSRQIQTGKAINKVKQYRRKLGKLVRELDIMLQDNYKVTLSNFKEGSRFLQDEQKQKIFLLKMVQIQKGVQLQSFIHYQLMKRPITFVLVVISCLICISYQQGCYDPNCQYCTNSTINKCDNCKSGYTLTPNYTCIQCNIPQCDQCGLQNRCSKCIEHFNLRDNICYQCDIQYCLSCSSNNFCDFCNQTASSYVPNSNRDSCVLCNVDRCESCSTNNFCGICQNGYQLYSSVTNNISKCVTCNLYNCLQCSDDNICLKCSATYQVGSDGKCFKCELPCATCKLDHSCATCRTPFYAQIPDSSGNCVQNTIPHCAKLTLDNFTNTYGCSACATFFTYNATSRSCQLNCQSPCLTCQNTNSSSCNSCIDGYYLNNKLCLSCSNKGCKSCTSNTNCVACQDGFYLLNQQCKKCPSYCLTCKRPNQCTQLAKQNNGKSMFIDSFGNTALAVCASTCQVCSTANPQQCLKCQQGYYLSSGICKPCNSVCKSCKAQDPNFCLSCFNYGLLLNNTCVICNPNCLSCSIQSTSICTSCRIGSYLSPSNKTCVFDCPDNCLFCSNPVYCSQCRSGYTLFNDTENNQIICTQCLSSCRTCAAGQPGTCLQCGDGLYLDSTATCVSCSDSNCKTCTIQGCSICNDGYYITDQKTCAANCVLPCATCLTTNPAQCQSCIVGYTYSSTTLSCVPTTQCYGACSSCPLGYALKQGSCLKCSLINCLSCLSSDVNNCTSCVYGFYLDNSNNQCIACSTGCSTCLSAQACLSCSDGYTNTATSYSGTAGFQCLPCTGNCKTCQSSQTRCSSCNDQYQLKGWKCVKKFRFIFGMVVMTDKNTFYKNFVKFLKDLSKQFTGQTNATDVITLDSIRFGSVILSGSADPYQNSGDPNAAIYFQNLANAISANNQLGGLLIGSSSVSVTGGSITSNESSNSSLGLILGISIPLGVLLLAAIVILIVVKGKKMRDNPYNAQQSEDREYYHKDSKQTINRQYYNEQV